MKSFLSTFCVLLVFLLFIPVSVNSQNVFLAGGYNMSFSKAENFNFIVDRYNETRNYLDHEMKQFRYFDGFCIAFGGVSNGFGFSMDYTGRNKSHFAKGVNLNNESFHRDLKYHNNVFGVNIGTGMGDDKFAVDLGTRLEFAKFKTKTRIGNPSEIKSMDWTVPINELFVSAGFYMRFVVGNPCIIVEPYIVWTAFKIDAVELNQHINPNTYQNDPDYLPIRPRYIGLKLMAGLNWSD